MVRWWILSRHVVKAKWLPGAAATSESPRRKAFDPGLRRIRRLIAAAPLTDAYFPSLFFRSLPTRPPGVGAPGAEREGGKAEGQHQELGVGRQHFPHGVLELAPGFHAAADVRDPFLGDVLDMLLTLHHERERPGGMAGPVRTVAGGLAAAEVGEGKRARKQIARKLETTHQFKFALAKTRGQRTLGFVLHLIVLIP